MNTKQQIDNLKIGDMIVVHRKPHPNFLYRNNVSRNRRYGWDIAEIVGFTKASIKVEIGFCNYGVRKDSFSTTWDLYGEVEKMEEAMPEWNCIECKANYPFTKNIYSNGKCYDCYVADLTINSN